MKTFIVFIAVLSGTAFAQYDNDEPIPFDDETPDAPLPRRQPTVDPDDFSEQIVYQESSFQSLARQDDPSVGLSLELHGGVIWLADSKKSSSARLALGTRLTWEWGRVFLDDEYWRQVFFVDLTWNFTQATQGTDAIYAKTAHHYVVLAPAWSFPFSQNRVAFFVQSGLGILALDSKLTAGKLEATTKGVFLLGQYGLGFRARLPLGDEKAFFIVLRTEFSGYVQRHAHDFMLSAGVGAGF